ncbi:helix-turn-helix domain-containing protein [Pseudomonas syringae]|uniref:helix-turn-helix domain-containing protein n=1 Tax=Pseudomonas syringae TaxID=317 RepID=UPI000403EB69|nr:helix-turn-helix transcriptional regulator [Pseudomonas syringae]
MENFGERLIEERRKSALSQSDFATMGGVRANAQANYEMGKRKPKLDYLAAIAKGGVDVLYIVTGKHVPMSSAGLNVREVEVIQDYRKLNDGDQRALERISASLPKHNNVPARPTLNHQASENGALI